MPPQEWQPSRRATRTAREVRPPIGAHCCRCIGFGGQRRHDVVKVVSARSARIGHIVVEKHRAEIEVAAVETVDAGDYKSPPAPKGSNTMAMSLLPGRLQSNKLPPL